MDEHKAREGPKKRGHTRWRPEVRQCTGVCTVCWCTSCASGGGVVGRIHRCDRENLYHTINGDPCHIKGQLRHKEGVKKATLPWFIPLDPAAR